MGWVGAFAMGRVGAGTVPCICIGFSPVSYGLGPKA